MIVHPKQLFVSCTDCRAVFYALGFGGFLPVGPLPPSPPPTTGPLRSLCCSSLYLFKGLVALHSVGGGPGGEGGGPSSQVDVIPLAGLR